MRCVRVGWVVVLAETRKSPGVSFPGYVVLLDADNPDLNVRGLGVEVSEAQEPLSHSARTCVRGVRCVRGRHELLGAAVEEARYGMGVSAGAPQGTAEELARLNGL